MASIGAIKPEAQSGFLHPDGFVFCGEVSEAKVVAFVPAVCIHVVAAWYDLSGGLSHDALDGGSGVYGCPIVAEIRLPGRVDSGESHHSGVSDDCGEGAVGHRDMLSNDVT